MGKWLDQFLLKKRSSSTDTLDTLYSMSRMSVGDVVVLERFEERAAIIEYDGNINREEAETLAWKDINK
jgi:hypothetical protein